MKFKKLLSLLVILAFIIGGCSPSNNEEPKKEETKKEETIPDISKEDAKKNVVGLKDTLKSASIELNAVSIMSKADMKNASMKADFNYKVKYIRNDSKYSFLGAYSVLGVADKKMEVKGDLPVKPKAEKYEMFIGSDGVIKKKVEGSEFKTVDKSELDEDIYVFLPMGMHIESISSLFDLVDVDNIKLEQDGSTYTISCSLTLEELKKAQGKEKSENKIDLSAYEKFSKTDIKIIMDKKSNLPKEQSIFIDVSDSLGEGLKGTMEVATKYLSINDINELKID